MKKKTQNFKKYLLSFWVIAIITLFAIVKTASNINSLYKKIKTSEHIIISLHEKSLSKSVLLIDEIKGYLINDNRAILEIVKIRNMVINKNKTSKVKEVINSQNELFLSVNYLLEKSKDYKVLSTNNSFNEVKNSIEEIENNFYQTELNYGRDISSYNKKSSSIVFKLFLSHFMNIHEFDFNIDPSMMNMNSKGKFSF